MTSLIAILHTIAIAAGFWGIVFVAFLQEVFPPLPSTAVAMSLGFLLFGGQPVTGGSIWQLFLQVGLPIAIGLTAGAVIIYYVVLKLGVAVIDRWGKWIGVTRADIEKLQARMQGSRFDDLILLGARAFPIMPSVAVNIVSGIIRTRLITFIVLTFVGTVIRAMWAALIGWQVGSAFETYAATIERIQTYIFFAVFLCALVFIWHRRRTHAADAGDPSSSLHR